MDDIVTLLLAIGLILLIYIAPARFAGNRGGSALVWFIISIFLPGISWILVLLLYAGNKAK